MYLLDEDLLLLLQRLGNVKGNFENISDDICGRQGQPLCE